MTISKQTKFKHGISENGELQVYQVIQVLKDGTVIDEKILPPYSPADPKIMDGFDDISKDIATAITEKTAVDGLKAEKTEPTGTGLEEIVTYDRTVDELGRISVRRITRIFDDGAEISKKYHRSWIMPGDDLSGVDVLSKALAARLHTPEVIAGYKEKMAEVAEIR